MNKKIIFVIGAPASGKTTYAKTIAAKEHSAYLGIGELVRAAIKAGKISAADIVGFYAPEEMVRHILLDAVFDSLQVYDSIIVDNFPRNIGQLLFIETAFPAIWKELVVFNPPKSLLMERIGLRNRQDDTEERVLTGITEINNVISAFDTLPNLSYIFSSILIYDHGSDKVQTNRETSVPIAKEA